jgi:hypothetical protein
MDRPAGDAVEGRMKTADMKDCDRRVKLSSNIRKIFSILKNNNDTPHKMAQSQSYHRAIFLFAVAAAGVTQTERSVGRPAPRVTRHSSHPTPTLWTGIP